MKCPYRTITLHVPSLKDGFYVKHPKDVIDFADCYRYECPFYKSLNRCGRVEKECEAK